MDGNSYQGYKSCVYRTFCVGKATQEQKELYKEAALMTLARATSDEALRRRLAAAARARARTWADRARELEDFADEAMSDYEDAADVGEDEIFTWPDGGTTMFAGIIEAANAEHISLGLLFGLVFMLAGLAFKVSAAPFHMWTPDVYDGAPSYVTGFMATAVKAEIRPMIVPSSPSSVAMLEASAT